MRRVTELTIIRRIWLQVSAAIQKQLVGQLVRVNGRGSNQCDNAINE